MNTLANFHAMSFNIPISPLKTRKIRYEQYLPISNVCHRSALDALLSRWDGCVPIIFFCFFCSPKTAQNPPQMIRLTPESNLGGSNCDRLKLFRELRSFFQAECIKSEMQF
jgi:hypothetical protein